MRRRLLSISKIFGGNRGICSLVVSAVIYLSVASSVAAADMIYVYERSDGSRLVTDHPRQQAGYQLIKRYPIVGQSRSYTLSPALTRKHYRALTSRYDQLIQRAAVAHGVDTALVKAVVHAESAFNPVARSNKGATGLMQLMPSTAARYGVKNLTDPKQNVDAGVRYLRDLLAMFEDNTSLALAAYNAGEGAVIKYNGIPPYNETRHYVAKVLSLHQTYQGRLSL